MAENKKIVVVNLQKLEVAPIGWWCRRFCF